MYGTIYIEVGERFELSDGVSIRCVETKFPFDEKSVCDKCVFYNHPERKFFHKRCLDLMCLRHERRDYKSVHFELDK